MNKKSWKTSTAGGAAIVACLGSVAQQLFDGNPATNPDWNYVIPILFTGLVGVFSRDNDKRSEDVIKPV